MEKVKHFIDTQLKQKDSVFWLVMCYVEIVIFLLIAAGFIKVW